MGQQLVKWQIIIRSKEWNHGNKRRKKGSKLFWCFSLGWIWNEKCSAVLTSEKREDEKWEKKCEIWNSYRVAIVDVDRLSSSLVPFFLDKSKYHFPPFSTLVWAIFILETENTTDKMRKSSFFFGSSGTSRLSFQLTSALLVRPREIHSSMCLLLSSTRRARGDETERFFYYYNDMENDGESGFLLSCLSHNFSSHPCENFKMGRIWRIFFVHIVHIPTVLVTQFVSIIRSCIEAFCFSMSCCLF